jgi:hypothetical protein
MKRLGRPPNERRAAARAAGRNTFMAVDPCKRCGTRRRYTCNSGCVQCNTARGIAYYASIKDDPVAKRHYNAHHYKDAA